MMESSGSRILDHAKCDSCKHLVTEKDEIIDDLRRNLLTQENRVQDLENEVKYVEEKLRNVVQERDALRSKQLSVERSITEDATDERENDRNIEILQDQLKHLDEEKKHLDEKIHDFEHETTDLARMFQMLQEKFEHEMKNKIKTLNAGENERKQLEDELENTRNELGKMKTETEFGKDLIEDLKISIQKKDKEAMNLSNLHIEAKNFIKELKEQFSIADENLKSQKSKNEVLKENIGSYIENIEVLEEENRRLKVENYQLHVSELNESEEKRTVEKEVQMLNDHMECLQKEIKENQQKYVELHEANVKLKQEKNDLETQIQKFRGKNVDLRIDIEELKKEIVLVTGQNHALESKMSLVQAEIKNVKDKRETLQHELVESQNRIEKAEENLAIRTIEKRTLEEEVKALEKVSKHLKIENEQKDRKLEKTEKILENETKTKEKLEEDVKVLDQVINDLETNIQRQIRCLEETKRELDSVLVTKQQLLIEVQKLEDMKTDMKMNINRLSQDIETMHGVCQSKAEKLEDLKRSVNEKSRVILSQEKKEKELQSHIEELLSVEEICANELTNAKDEITKLRKENIDINENFEKMTVQYQECLQELSEKNEMYTKSIKQYEEQMEELSRFRELNVEINSELRNRNDEINLLTMEKDELLRDLESTRNVNNEMDSIKLQMEKYKENEKDVLQKLSGVKRKHETILQELHNEKDEKNDLECQLKNSREKAERWKKLSFEIKQERNSLQIQIAELDRDLNEKRSNLAEEKSSLEKENETLKLVVKRLKSNEENLRGKIEKLRDEVDKLSDANSEQEMEKRKLSWEKQKIAENLAKLQNVAEENIALQSELKEIKCENAKLKHDVDALQEKVRDLMENNERLEKDHKMLQDHDDVMQTHVHEATRETKQLKNNFNILQDSNCELTEEKERLFNENCRLKEKKSSIVQDRNKLQDMIESLDKCHSEKNDALSQQNTLLENELASQRATIKRCEEKELGLLNGIQELNEKVEKSIDENDKMNGLLKKADGENIRLRKKVSDLGKMVEQIDHEREARINLEAELNGKEEVLNKHKESKKNLNDLISTLYCQQNELKNELRNKERELNDLNNDLKTERSDKAQWKIIIRELEDELQKTKAREMKCSDQVKNEKEKNEKAEQVLTRLKKQSDNLKEVSKRDKDEYNKKIENFDNKTHELLDKIKKLQDDYDRAKHCNENLNNKIRNLEEKYCSLEVKKSQQDENVQKKDEQLVNLAKETNVLKKENKRLQEHTENIDRILTIQNSAAQDQASGMEKEIKVLHDTLSQLRTTGDVNRAEIDELKRKLKTSYQDKMNAEVKLNDIRLERERLKCRNGDLLSNCSRLEELVKEGEQLKLENENKKRLLENEQQRNRVIEGKLANESRELLEKEKLLENLKEELSDYKEKIEKLNISKDGLIAAIEELTRINDEGSKEIQLTSEKNGQLVFEKNRLNKLVAFCKDEMENLRKEADQVKTNLQLKMEEAENDIFQLQNDVKMKEENLHRLTQKNNELQESLKNVKEEVNDLEDENEDLLAEVEQLKEVNKKSKVVFCTLQTEHNVLQEELREKENNWNEEKEKRSLEILKMGTDITNLNNRLTQANDRNEKRRELEKMLRFEIDELSDGYVELEQEIQHRNDEIILLKDKLQTLSQNIEELELSRDTACLLKEKRHCELLKAEKNVQRLEKNLGEKQKTNKKLQKELDSVLEKQKYLELQVSSEKELSGQHLKQIQDLQNSERKVDEQLWKAKRDIEKLQTEIDTWRISSDSMKVRIETLEDELNKTSNEKYVISTLYEESKRISEVREEQILKLKFKFSEKTAAFETMTNEMCNEKSDLNQKLIDLENQLDKKSVEISTLDELLEGINNKYQDSLLVTSLLHNDIQKKDERIADLEERKKQVTNLLAELDLKIAEIQVQAEGLEADNEFHRKQITKTIKSQEHLRQTLEEERTVFADKCERHSREIQHLQNKKDHFMQLVLEANRKIEDKNTEMMKFQKDHEKLLTDKHFLVNSKKRLEDELREMKSHEEKLKKNLSTEKEKTLKQNLEIEHLLKDCELLKTKCSIASEEHKETEKKLTKANTSCQELENNLEERKAEVLKIQEVCENWENKAKQLEESLYISTAKNDKLLQMKNEEIGSLTIANGKMKNVIDEAKSELDQQTANLNTNELENRCLKEKIEHKQERIDDLDASCQNMMNSNKSLEEEKKGLLIKLETISWDLNKREDEKQQLITENKDLVCVVKAKEKEFKEYCNVLKTSQEKLEEEIFEQKSTIENLLMENSELRQKANERNAQMTQTTNSLDEIRRKLEDREKENKKLKLALQNSNFERNCLAEVNSKVNDALDMLQKESKTSLTNGKEEERGREIDVARNRTQLELMLLESEKESNGKQDEACHSLQSKQAFAMKSFELQNNFSQIENELRTLRTVVSNKENEISGLEASLDLLQNEMDAQCSQLFNYMQKFQDECKQKNSTLETVKKLDSDLENLKEEKCSIAVESQEKIMDLQHELLAKELLTCDLRGKTVLCEENLQVLKTLIEEKSEQITELENAGITTRIELEAVDSCMEKTHLQVLNLERALNICGEENYSISRSDEHNHVERYDELSSKLTHRFERVLENVQSHVRENKRLRKDLADAEIQSSIHSTELEASKNTYKNLKVECGQLQIQLSLVTCDRDATLCKVAKLSESLTTAETRMERTQISQNEENSKISQELQKMQRELTLACDKFNCSISKSRSLEEKIKTREKRIADLEQAVQMSGVNNRMLQIKIAELDATTDILFNTNKELEDKEKQYEEKMTRLQCTLHKEKAERSEDTTKRDATIRKLELKNINLDLQIVRAKEHLNKAQKTTDEVQKELDTLKIRYKDAETTSSAEIADCQSKIVELQQDISNIEKDAVRLDNERFVLANRNEDLMKTICNIEIENIDFRDILKQSEEEKETMNKNLARVFDTALNDEVHDGINSQIGNLRRVIEMIEELKRCNEDLTKENQDVKENILKLEKENVEIRSQYRTKCEEYERQKQHSSELANLIKDQENNLDESKVKCQQLNTELQELEENIEALKVNEDQQHYQYQVLEKEKEDLESEVIYLEEEMEKYTEKLNESVHLLNECNLDATSGNLEDSGIGFEDNSMNIISNREPLDGGVFSSGIDKYISLPASSNPEEMKKMRHLETAVHTCVQMMSKIVPTFKERERFFSNKEKHLVEEIRGLKQASVQNEKLLSSLEKEVERLEFSQRSLQKTYHEKDENLNECQMKLEHAMTISSEKEMSIMILNKSVQEYKRRQEYLEKELDTTKRSNEQLMREKLETSITIQDHEKEFEILKQKCLESDAETEKKTTSLRLRITELENGISEKENVNLEFQHHCTTLRETVEQLKNQAQECSLTITSYKDQVQDLEKQRNEETRRGEELSQKLDNCREQIRMLETMNQTAQESSKDVKNRLHKASVDLEKSRIEVIQLKEGNVLVKLERDSLADKVKLRKKLLKEKECTIEQITSEITEKHELLRKSETKLTLVNDFLQEINLCKDDLEKDINELKDENSDLKKQTETLKHENTRLLGSVQKKEKEVVEKYGLNYELDKENNEIKNELLAKNTELAETMDELRMSLTEAKRVKNQIEGLQSLFETNTGYNCFKTECHDEMNTYNLILSIGTRMNNLSLVCQKLLIEKENLQKDAKEQSVFLENERNEKSTLEREMLHVNEKVSALSKDLANVQSVSKEQQQELKQRKNELNIEKQRNDELVSVNVSLKERIKLLEDDVSSISTHAENLKVDRNNLKDSLLKTHNEIAKLQSKLNRLNDDLGTAKHTINELNHLQDKTITAKEDIETALQYTQQKLTDLQTLQKDQTKQLCDTQVTLTQERDRIVTLTKLARMKEGDLGNAKMAITLKDELIGQMKEQIEEVKETCTSTKKELEKVMKQLTTVQQRKEKLSNEKVSLWKDCNVLKDRLEQIQKEKEKLEMKLDMESKRTSIALEKMESQKQTLSNLENEVELHKEKCYQLQNEKSQITNEAKDKERRCELECDELLEKSHVQSKTMEKTVLHLKSELMLSENLRSGLEQRIYKHEVDLTALQDQNNQLEAEVETRCDQENNLTTENKHLKESVKCISDENMRLQNSLEKANQHLGTLKTSLAEKERGNNTLRKKILSDKETIHTQRNETSNSKSEINDLKCKAVESKQNLDKVIKELAHEKNTVSTLHEDKTNLEELYQLSQNLETSLRKDLENAKLQIDNIRNENLGLRKENTWLECKDQESGKTIKKLKSDSHTISTETLEKDKQISEAKRDLEKANEDLYLVHSAVTKICTTTKTMQKRFHASIFECQIDVETYKEENHFETSSSSGKPNITKLECSATDVIFEELRALEITLTQIRSSFETLFEIESRLENNMNEHIQENRKLKDDGERQAEKVESLQENQSNLLRKNDQLEAHNREVTTFCEKIKEECKTVEELLSNECTRTAEISNQLSDLKVEKQKLCESNHELEVSLDQCTNKNVDLNTKQQELKKDIQTMKKEFSSLETSYAKLCQEKRKIDEKALKRKEQILALESDLEASVEFSELMEKRFMEENENSTKLRVRVGTLESQVSVLENTLKKSQSQIEEMNSKVVFMDDEIRRTSLTLCEKNKEITELWEKLQANEEKLKTSALQVEHYKTTHEDVLKSKRETEEKLEQAELLLEKSKMLLHQETQSTNELTREKENVEEELQSTIMKLQERVDELTSELSTIMTNEETTKENLDSARATIEKLENNLKQQLLKMEESEETQKTTNEQLDNLKFDHITTKAKLHRTIKENEDLHHEKRELNQVVQRLKTKMTIVNHENEQKSRDVGNLEIQYAGEKEARQNLQNEISKLQADMDVLGKHSREKEEQLKHIVETKASEIDQISDKLVDEINRTDELQSSLNVAGSEMKNLKQRNEDVSKEIFILCQSLVRGLKPGDNSLLEEGSDNITDLSKIIDVIRSSHTLMQDNNNNLSRRISELNERLKETGKENEMLLFEKTHLENDLNRIRKESDIIEMVRNSLAKELESCQHGHEVTIEEFKQREECLQETSKIKKEEYLTLHSEMKVIEKERASLEEEVGRLQLKLGNTIIELTTANTTNEVLESKNNDLILANSHLHDNQASLQNKLNATEKETKELSEKLSMKENELSKLVTAKDATETEKMATQEFLEVKENEIIRLKNNLDELEKQKIDLEKQINDLKELNNQIEKDTRDLQLTSSQTQADNSELRRQIECERSENVTTTTRLECDLDNALTSLEKQHSKLSQVQNEKNIINIQLLQAEKELKVIMEDNAYLKNQMYHNTTISKVNDELLRTKFQVSKLRQNEAALSQENKCLKEQLRNKSDELIKLKFTEQGFKREMENKRENMRRYLNERDKWEEEVKSVISEIGHEKKSEL